MKTNKLQKELQSEHQRAMHARVGAVALACITLFGAGAVEHENRSFLREATARTAYTFSNLNTNNSGRENETTRMPVKYDDVLRLQTIGGS